jgi:hypothetical protein
MYTLNKNNTSPMIYITYANASNNTSSHTHIHSYMELRIDVKIDEAN